MNNFGALRVFYFQVSNKFLTLFSNCVLICNISDKISRKINGQMLLHGTEATQNRFFAFWGYCLAIFIKKATTFEGFFSWKLLRPLSTARKNDGHCDIF